MRISEELAYIRWRLARCTSDNELVIEILDAIQYPDEDTHYAVNFIVREHKHLKGS